MKILIASSPDKLEDALKAFTKTATVEAEYGDRVVTGSFVTLAHHVKGYKEMACPCLFANFDKAEKIDAIGVSHFDLDTLGGVLALMGRKPLCAEEVDRSWALDRDMGEEFWEVAAFVDMNGPHRIDPKRTSAWVYRSLEAFWAWSQENRLFPPRDGSVLDATEFFETAGDVITRIFNGDPDLYKAGEEWAKAGKALNEDSFHSLRLKGGVTVVVRDSPKFVNHLYKTPLGPIAQAVLNYNPDTGAITLSFDGDMGISARKVMQAVFGPDAGGHDGIAGSPRGKGLEFHDTEKVLDALSKY